MFFGANKLPSVIQVLPQLQCLILSNVVFFQPLLDMLQDLQVFGVVHTINETFPLPSSAVVPQMYALHGSLFVFAILNFVHFFLG